MNDPDRDMPSAPSSTAKQRPSFWLVLLGAVALAFLYVAITGRHHGFGNEEMGARHPAVGRRLPSLELEALTGDSQDLTLKDLEGKVVVINFWATWCPPCQAELPEIAALWFQLRDQPDVRLLSVSCNDEDTELGPLREKTREYLARKQFQMPTYADQSERTRRVVAMILGEDYFAFPTTLVLDQSGVIRGAWIGYEAGIGDRLKQIVEELSREEPRKSSEGEPKSKAG